jgi:hypothetical protein
MLNTSNVPLAACGINFTSGPSQLAMSFQTTNPATNALTGELNRPVQIAANSFQTFVLSFQASAPLSVTAQPLNFFCTDVVSAPVTLGVNTIDLLFSSTPVTDIIALAASAQPGIVVVSQSTGGGAFAVATVNVGVTGTLTVSADTGAASLPLSVSLCPTNPTTGACLAAPSATVTQSFAAGGTPTFAIFVSASAPIAFAPGTSRVFVRFKDASGVAHGSTSVAVETN